MGGGSDSYIGNSNENNYHNAIVGNLTNVGFEKILNINGLSSENIKNVNIASIITNIENTSPPIFTFETSYNRLENIFVNENNLNYSDISGILYNKQKNQIIRYPPKSNVNYKDILTYDSTISSIDKYAFKGISQLDNIIFSNTINTIGSNSFANNSNLHSIGFFYGTDLKNLDLEENCFHDICENLLIFRDFNTLSNNFIDSYTNSTNINYIDIDQYFVDIIDVKDIYVQESGHLHPEIFTYNSFLQETGHNFGIIFNDDYARNKFLHGLEMSDQDFSNSDVTIKYLNKNQDLYNPDINLLDISNLTEINNQQFVGGKNYVLIRYVRGIFIHTSPFIYTINIQDTISSPPEYDSAILILYDGNNTIYKDISINQTDISIGEVSTNTFYIMTLIYYEYRNYSNLVFSYKEKYSWKLVFRQTYPFLWGGENDLDLANFSYNEDDDTNANYSILNKLENYRNDGKFRFKYTDNTGKINDWTQTNNPITTSTVTGYNSISIDDSSYWEGLSLSSSKHTIIASKGTHIYYTIGFKALWYINRFNGYPTFPSNGLTGNTLIELYVFNYITEF